MVTVVPETCGESIVQHVSVYSSNIHMSEMATFSFNLLTFG